MSAILDGCSGLMHVYICMYMVTIGLPRSFLIWFKQCELKPSRGYNLCDCDFADDSVTMQ